MYIKNSGVETAPANCAAIAKTRLINSPQKASRLVCAPEDDPIVFSPLNKKGYKTKYSCSGHPSARFKRDKFRDGVLNKRLYSTARIVFAKDYDFPSIPKGWEMKVLDEDKVGIYVKPPTFKIMDGLPKEAFYKWKKKYMYALENWVSNLPKFGEQNKTDEKEVVESTINDLMIDCL